MSDAIPYETIVERVKDDIDYIAGSAYARGYNTAKSEIALSGEYERAYMRGKKDALHWIPCSERLPKKEERSYWICLDGGGQCQCRWTNDMYGFGANEYSKWGWHIMDKPQYSKVVAWMPLPKPYEERKEQ